MSSRKNSPAVDHAAFLNGLEAMHKKVGKDAALGHCLIDLRLRIYVNEQGIVPKALETGETKIAWSYYSPESLPVILSQAKRVLEYVCLEAGVDHVPTFDDIPTLGDAIVAWNAKRVVPEEEGKKGLPEAWSRYAIYNVAIGAEERKAEKKVRDAAAAVKREEAKEAARKEAKKGPNLENVPTAALMTWVLAPAKKMSFAMRAKAIAALEAMQEESQAAMTGRKAKASAPAEEEAAA